METVKLSHKTYHKHAVKVTMENLDEVRRAVDVTLASDDTVSVGDWVVFYDLMIPSKDRYVSFSDILDDELFEALYNIVTDKEHVMLDPVLVDVGEKARKADNYVRAAQRNYEKARELYSEIRESLNATNLEIPNDSALESLRAELSNDINEEN